MTTFTTTFITPKEVVENYSRMPDFLIKVFNELIKVKFDGKSSVVSYKEVRSYVTSVSTYDNELNYRLSYELFTKMTIPQINEYCFTYTRRNLKS